MYRYRSDYGLELVSPLHHSILRVILPLFSQKQLLTLKVLGQPFDDLATINSFRRHSETGAGVLADRPIGHKAATMAYEAHADRLYAISTCWRLLFEVPG